MAHDVFISYSSKDQKIVEAMSHYLEENGVRCFVAYRDIPVARVWAEVITEAIEECQIMIVVFSDNFNQSRHVDREIELAADEEKYILPYKITDTELKGAKKYYLKNINWIDAYPNPEALFCDLLNQIQKILGGNINPSNPTIKVRSNMDCDVYNFDEKLTSLKCNEFKPIHINKGANVLKFVSTDNVLDFKEVAFNMGNSDLFSCIEMIDLIYIRDKRIETESTIEKAIKGDVKAQALVGAWYLEGTNVEKNIIEAERWLRLAAEQGDAGSQHNMGCYYNRKKDADEAAKWFEKAAKQGIPNAQYSLGLYYYHKDNCIDALHWFLKSANLGFADAQYMLGVYYRYPHKGMVTDATVARKWFEKAARQGHKQARKELLKM